MSSNEIDHVSVKACIAPCNNAVAYAALLGYNRTSWPSFRVPNTLTATFTLGNERLVDEDEEEGADFEDDDTDDDDDDDEQEMRVFGECEELEEYDEEYEEAGN